jgi:hypothetical protein
MIGMTLALAMMQTAATTEPSVTIPGVTVKSFPVTGPLTPEMAGVDCPRYLARRQPLSVIGLCQPAKPTPDGTHLVPATYWNADRAARRWSGLAADGPSLRLAQGAVQSGDELARLQVRQAYGGRLTRELNGKTWGGGGRRFLPAGTPVYGLADFSQPNFAGNLWVWCAPANVGKAAMTPDRALCFIDRRQHAKAPGVIPFVPLNADDMNTIVMSKSGESPYAPGAIDFAYSPPVKPPEAEPTGEPYPYAMTLVVRWTAEGAGARFDATLDDGSGPRPFRTWHDKDAASGVFLLAGGFYGYSREGNALTVKAMSPIQDGALVQFTPDLSASPSR